METDQNSILRIGQNALGFMRMKLVQVFGESSVDRITQTVIMQDDAKRVALQKQEIIMRLTTTVLGLIFTFGFSYYGLQWILNAMDPTKQDKKEAQKRARNLMKAIGVEDVKLTEHELCIASNLVDPSTLVTEWNDIGGLKSTIDEIRETIIDPFKHHKLYNSTRLLRAPKGVLLYGPPGCGKTMIAKATAKATGARFLNLQVASLTDKWYGETQKRTEAVFSLAQKLQPIIIFIDEIDSFLRSRAYNDHEATNMVKTQFMGYWDGLGTDDNCRIMIIGATNRPSDVDAAILRRMPSMFHIGLPDQSQREQILRVILKDESLSDTVDYEYLSGETEGLSGSDLRELCRSAAILRVRELMRISETERGVIPTSLGQLTLKDFNQALVRIRESKRISSASLQQFTLD
jgi:SpoVK/Ycf46/Vps4 family AAA+-type ATPase